MPDEVLVFVKIRKFKNRRNNILAQSQDISIQKGICFEFAQVWYSQLHPRSFSTKILRFSNNIAKISTKILRNFAGNLHRYKANFLWWFPTNLEVFTVCEVNYSYQFCYSMKKMSGWYSKWRENWSKEDA